MAFFEEMESRYVPYLRTHLHQFAASVSAASCEEGPGAGGDDECRDEPAALRLKMVAVATILVAGAIGVAIPLVGGEEGSSSGSGTFVLAKAFAAGVILATGFVHMLHDAEEKLSDPCLPAMPWRRFPFPGFIAMLAALGTLVMEFVGTRFYERRHGEEAAAAATAGHDDTTALLEDGALAGVAATRMSGDDDKHDAMHIVGMRAHAAAHQHSHAHGHDACDGGAVYDAHAHGSEERPSQARHVVVSQAQFKNFSALLMAFFFAITTPVGIALGAGVASFYSASSPRAFMVEGILDSMSSGILIYIALVDLIAADFLSRRMSCNPRLQVCSYVVLLVGAVAMSALAIWA
ncbi:zinc transporter 10-like isoform X2 [Triticum urartu]|uniref:zinc transporter 10-like isoform X2 n=1 Tax=Triticum urartu TaxID=4572 RepID=UPI0020441CEA|nr:zinc transporter 10-like isoform X2 [Triticum urartu]